ncbi:hypothetical protein [Alteribacter natronophilus]|uniref:hypothetical protein n=1 Tax=Alteribacter natronophilus TaxID=2583810 RepID=UPI00110E4E5E|nr:hypothetical protein [Alteribacter natronophilus]TMW70707.1 hypothetical protein FGB90_16125 [Alteribacter natronophilus]
MKYGKPPVPKNIMFDCINVQSISACSGIFVGENVQYDWTMEGKINAAAGSMTGDCNIMVHVFNVVYDNDWMDSSQFENGGGNGENGCPPGKQGTPKAPAYFC